MRAALGVHARFPSDCPVCTVEDASITLMGESGQSDQNGRRADSTNVQVL